MSTIPLCTHRYIGLRHSCWAEISVFLMVIHDCKRTVTDFAVAELHMCAASVHPQDCVNETDGDVTGFKILSDFLIAVRFLDQDCANLTDLNVAEWQLLPDWPSPRVGAHVTDLNTDDFKKLAAWLYP